MTLQTIVAIAELVAAVAVVVSLVYLATQVRHGNRVASAAARHSISEYVLNISLFRAEHADRMARISEGKDLTAGDLQFRWWSHMMMLCHAETYFHHHEQGLSPTEHWSQYANFLREYLQAPDVQEFWDEAGHWFSLNFSNWISSQLAEIRPKEKSIGTGSRTK